MQINIKITLIDESMDSPQSVNIKATSTESSRMPAEQIDKLALSVGRETKYLLGQNGLLETSLETFERYFHKEGRDTDFPGDGEI